MSDIASPPLSPQPDTQVTDRFLCLLLLAELLLLISTWPLWTTINRFPAIPFLTSLAPTTVIVDQLMTFLLGFATTAGAITIWKTSRTEHHPDTSRSPILLRSFLTTALVSGCVLVLLNQHRLQPWHWLFLLILFQSILIRCQEHLWLFRITIASIYVFAALSRVGPNIDNGMSLQVLRVLADFIGMSSLLKTESFVFGGCLIMTTIEFLTGIGLLIPRLRSVALVAAATMHFTLLLALSTLGLNHHWGVLVWNGFLLMAVPVLFSGQSDGRPITLKDRSASAKVVAAFVLLFPVSGLFGLADNWPSWQLYSPRPEVVKVYVHENAVADLPSDITPFIGQPAPLDVWCPIRIDRWALAATYSPVYPEDRFQLAVVAQLIASTESPESFRILKDSPQAPAWWQRTHVELNAEDATRQSTEFFFNGSAARAPLGTSKIQPSVFPTADQ